MLICALTLDFFLSFFPILLFWTTMVSSTTLMLYLTFCWKRAFFYGAVEGKFGGWTTKKCGQNYYIFIRMAALMYGVLKKSRCSSAFLSLHTCRSCDYAGISPHLLWKYVICPEGEWCKHPKSVWKKERLIMRARCGLQRNTSILENLPAMTPDHVEFSAISFGNYLFE